MVVPPSVGGGIPSMAGAMTTMRVNPQSTSHAVGGVRGKMGPVTHAPAPNPPPQPAPNPVLPLSARKAQALDLNTVQRRGGLPAPREPPKRTIRPHNLEEAPTFRPTDEEWKNPIEYIMKIGPEGRKYGIAKIIPPDWWNPDFAIDTERFHFKTRKQELNMAEGGTRANLTYLDALAKFHKQRNGTNLNRFPSVDKRPLDLYKLKKFVEDKGGFETVCKQKRWAEIGRDLGYSGKIMSSLSTSLKNSYQKWLQPYEDWLRFNKPNVLQQQELENGGPYTPSPAPTPSKSNLNTPNNVGPNSPAVRASTALNATLQDGPGAVASPVPSVEAPMPLQRPTLVSGFTPVNAGGFTAVNAPQQSSGFSAINGLHRETDTGQSTPARSVDSPLTSAKNTPDLRPFKVATSLAPVLNGPVSNPLKRQLSSDGDSGTSADAEAAGRRSKRLRKDAPPTVTGSHMVQPRLPPQQRFQAPRDRSAHKPGELCEQCGRADDRANFATCDDCKAAYHIYCLEPPIKAVPDEDWHCPRCLVCTSTDFGFQEGGIYSLREFQELAHAHKQKHFKDKLAFDPIKNEYRQPSEEDVEREFWRLTESLEGQEPVEYGADIHSTTHGSGFPTMERDPYNRYSKDPWNLNNLPLDKESLFRHIKTDICGMTVPWLYVGMCFSTFCWHAEDHYTYSANYQHFGDTKTWYGIPAEDSERFEAAMREAVPELFEQQPDLLFQLVTLLQPEKLKKAGVRVHALDQRAGQFVITFPRAYHAGFNHGFNFNEAVNFAPSDWEPYGQDAVQRLRDFRRPPVFSHDELLFSAVARDHTIKTAKWLGPALQRTLDREIEIRQAFNEDYRLAKVAAAGARGEHVSTEEIAGVRFPFEKDSQDVADEEMVCVYCKSYGYLSRFTCGYSKKTLCLLHAGKFECCDGFLPNGRTLLKPNHTVHLRMSDSELQSTVQKVVDLSTAPEVWETKLDKITTEAPNPSLKAMKALLAEGEKLNSQWELPGLPDLRRFVEKCNDWVEEATNYITRKQQNRRKNERAWRKSSNRNAEVEERERELRNVDNIKRLLRTADEIGFDCPELEVLRDRDEKITDFRKRAKSALSRAATSVQELEDLIEEGKNFSVDMPEVETLEKKVRTVNWYEEAHDHGHKISEGTSLSLQEVSEFIERGKDLGIHETEDTNLKYFINLKQSGEFWESKAKEVMAADEVNFQQLDALSKQAMQLPVSRETLAQIDAILQKQRDAQERIAALYERTKDPDFTRRPRYKDVVEAMEALDELNSKPPGTMDLEKEQKRHEDWMRRGKKLFGKTNAPLHILLQHMKYVEERNEHCLDVNDQPRMPVEPSSRANTPEEGSQEAEPNGSASVRDVFCICRKPESGMMIECEMCHEWYHGKCLKIARGKVKEDDKYTCPICDYRVKIPRDATRPKLEELEAWYEEIPTLPFQPEEEETLRNIIETAGNFRHHIQAFINPVMSTPDELPQQRFYLRKIEGAEILLSKETNFFRQEVHKWAPVAPNPPPLLEHSLSTRKPRPTKLQKQMKEMGVSNPNDLPEHLRPKPPGQKKKGSDGRKASSVFGQTDVPSTTPPGSPQSTLVDVTRRASDAIPRGSGTFATEAPAAAPTAHSPMFTPTSHSAYNRSHSPPAAAATGGIDPQLEDMFGAPSGAALPGAAQADDHAAPLALFPLNDSQDEPHHAHPVPHEAFGAFEEGHEGSGAGGQGIFGGEAMEFQHE